MKIFISHQQRDSAVAASIARRLLLTHSIESYLDLIDPLASTAGDTLGDHVRQELGKCTQLIAVVSLNTRDSWWVPWEIGIATEKDYPISTYAAEHCDLPTYLKKWPYLQSEQDLDTYAKLAKATESERAVKQSYFGEAVARARTTRDFHQSLKRSLRQ